MCIIFLVYDNMSDTAAGFGGFYWVLRSINKTKKEESE